MSHGCHDEAFCFRPGLPFRHHNVRSMSGGSIPGGSVRTAFCGGGGPFEGLGMMCSCVVAKCPPKMSAHTGPTHSSQDHKEAHVNSVYLCETCNDRPVRALMMTF